MRMLGWDFVNVIGWLWINVSFSCWVLDSTSLIGTSNSPSTSRAYLLPFFGGEGCLSTLLRWCFSIFAGLGTSVGTVTFLVSAGLGLGPPGSVGSLLGVGEPQGLGFLGSLQDLPLMWPVARGACGLTAAAPLALSTIAPWVWAPGALVCISWVSLAVPMCALLVSL